MSSPQNPQSSQGSSPEAPRQTTGYRGRFAPSPTGPLHAGSLASALGSWLDARAHGGQWLVRIEDVDTPRTVLGADQLILNQLKACGLDWDEAVVWQSQRAKLYQEALDQLIEKDFIYGCTCSRKQIEEVLRGHRDLIERHGELVYPGTCREQARDEEKMALRMALPQSCVIEFDDQTKAQQSQDLAKEVGDFVLRRADGLFTYQLAVVVDDHLQGITHVVRGEDLLSNTARQIHLQRSLGYQTPSYRHLPLVTNAAGEKLSKQTQALGIDTSNQNMVLRELNSAAAHLGIWNKSLNTHHTIDGWLLQAIKIWGLHRI